MGEHLPQFLGWTWKLFGLPPPRDCMPQVLWQRVSKLNHIGSLKLTLTSYLKTIYSLLDSNSFTSKFHVIFARSFSSNPKPPSILGIFWKSDPIRFQWHLLGPIFRFFTYLWYLLTWGGVPPKNKLPETHSKFASGHGAEIAPRFLFFSYFCPRHWKNRDFCDVSFRQEKSTLRIPGWILQWFRVNEPVFFGSIIGSF